MDDSDRQLLLRLLARSDARAEALEAEVRALRAAPVRTGKTVLQLFELFAATWEDEPWAPQMRATFKSGLKCYGTRIADEVTRAEWVHWRDRVRAKETTIRKDAEGNNTPPSIYTRNQEFKRWRQCYRWGQAEGHVTNNPLADVRAARGGKKHRETEPTLDELATVRPHCDDRTWAFIKLGARRGFRAKEARLLEWRQIDLERATITLYAWQDKTRKTHLMRIPSDVVAALRAIRTDLPGRYVFPGRSGPMNATTLWRRVRLAFDTAGLKAAPGDRRVTFHDTRHSFTSRAARKVPLQVAMRLSRHTSLSAAQRYIHVNDSDMEGAYEKLEEDARIGPQRAPEKPGLDNDAEKNSSGKTLGAK